MKVGRVQRFDGRTILPTQCLICGKEKGKIWGSDFGIMCGGIVSYIITICPECRKETTIVNIFKKLMDLVSNFNG